MAFWHRITGLVTAELTTADLYGTLQTLQIAKIELHDIQITSDFTVRFCIGRKDLKRLLQLAEKMGAELKITGYDGLIWSLLRLRKRPVLVFGMLAILVFTLWVPGRVFFVQVEGNLTIPTRQIVETAARCGISFGVSRREVRSEKMKNALLGAMPELSWAGVNTYGCTAVILVRERSEEEDREKGKTVSSIVAMRDGIIRQMTVLRGNGVCTVGQAVKAGQVLISGYTDCGISVQATDAQGEVFAETKRQITAFCPSTYSFRQKITASCKKYSLIIGKKRIFFSNNSGISDVTCAKIYEEKFIALPGGFFLPVAIATETWVIYASELQEQQMQESFSASARQYVTQQMNAGRIIAAAESFAQQDGVYLLHGSYSCYEMIGATKIEENISDYVKID